MIVKQLFEEKSSTYTYLLGCEETHQAVLIDPVLETVERDIALLEQLNFKLTCTLETHIHADHITSARKLKFLTHCQNYGPAGDNLECRDIGLKDGVALNVGTIKIEPLFTPGHTNTHFAYFVDSGTQKMVFTGDSLLINGCGRTDFQGGDSTKLYESITEKLFTLDDDTLVYPGHDYYGNSISNILQEKTQNPRLGQNKPLNNFLEIMKELKLPKPIMMDYAVPGNERCGECPPNVPDALKSPCEIDDIRQG